MRHQRLLTGLGFIALACGQAEDSGHEFELGSDSDPVVRAAKLAVAADACAGGVAQGLSVLYSQDMAVGANDAYFPSSAGMEIEFAQDWVTDGQTARPVHPGMPGGYGNALPLVTGFGKFVDVCDSPNLVLDVEALVDTRAATDATTDATLVLYYFAGDGSLLDVTTAYRQVGNRYATVGLYGRPMPRGTTRIAVVPMVRLGAEERDTVYYDDMKVVARSVKVGSSVSVASDFSGTLDPATSLPAGFVEYGGDWYVDAPNGHATLGNPAWSGGSPALDSGLVVTMPLTGVSTGAAVSARVKVQADFVDRSSFALMRLSFDVNDLPVDSERLTGPNADELVLQDVPVPAGAKEMYIQLIGNLGGSEKLSVAFDNLSVQVGARSAPVLAAKIYSPTKWFDAVGVLGGSAETTIPSEILIDTQTYPGAAEPWSLTAGNSGNHRTYLTLTTTNDGTRECTYQGGSSQAHPSGANQIALARRYVFKSCQGSYKAGDAVRITGYRLSVQNGESWLASTRVRLELPLRP